MTITGPDHVFSVAPMMECTDRHCRMFHRQLTAHALLYTEMLTSGAILHGDRARLLAFDPCEHPVALQIGGSDPDELSEAARIGAEAGYDEINLNVGCPSERVQWGRFGASLMAEPDLVARCISAMRAAVDVPVTVKCRIGIDDQDVEADLEAFISAITEAGCRTVQVHARKAWLQGLSPKQNRTVPPLDYGRVYRLKQAHPELGIVLNGGIETIGEAEVHLGQVDGVMLGRAAYHNPAILAAVDHRFYGAERPSVSRDDVIYRMVGYVEQEVAAGTRLHQITRHMLGLYLGQPGARAFRRHLSDWANKPGVGAEVLLAALDHMKSAARTHAHAGAS